MAVGKTASPNTAHTNVNVEAVAADLGTDEGIATVAELCAARPLSILNNAGVAHYMPLADLTEEQAPELVHVKFAAPMMLARATLVGMLERGEGTIINRAGMIAFSGPAPSSVMPRRAIYGGALTGTVAMTQLLAAELEDTPIRVHVVCPGIVVTEFHEVQGMDMSAVPRMSPQDIVTACRRGIELEETVIAPGVDDPNLLDAVFRADLAAFSGQSPELASRYRNS